MPKLLLKPDQQRYRVQYGTEVVSTDVKGGLPRVRRDFIGAPNVIRCSMTLDKDEFQYWSAFYHTTISRGATRFEMDIIDDVEGFREAEVVMDPGSYDLQSVSGNAHRIGFNVLVLPAVINEALNTGIVDMTNAYGDLSTAISVFNLLHDLVNVRLPEVNG